jgi:hypothetical protein
MITIQDPLSGASYFLDPEQKIATKVPSAPTGKNVMFSRDAGEGPIPEKLRSGAVAGGFVSGGEGPTVVMGFNAGQQGDSVPLEEKSESLGKETIAGLSADGTRTITSIPANAIGNERQLDIVRERWYSADLGIVLRSKQSDPRFGETTYEVTNLGRVGPSPSLFEVPSDYKLREAEPHVLVRHSSGPVTAR